MVPLQVKPVSTIPRFNDSAIRIFCRRNRVVELARPELRKCSATMLCAFSQFSRFGKPPPTSPTTEKPGHPGLASPLHPSTRRPRLDGLTRLLRRANFGPQNDPNAREFCMPGKLIGLLTASLLALGSLAADFKITALLRDGSMTVTNSYPQGVVTVFSSPSITGPWVPLKNTFSLATSAHLEFAPASTALYRALAADISGSGSWLF